MIGTKVPWSVSSSAAYHAPVILLYIDPGAGSLVIQAIIAAIVAVPFFFRNAIWSAVRRLRGVDQPAEKSVTDTTQE
jgi:replication-associated recombination protein RarA